ncbi:glycosyltransferase involved in cell wall biosynthesis [Dysgonomonas sp. PFB1-18]|uniref:glycosyltransferase family 4 protein n=1 Tax=unclassified Dysgonomonas TaxID=2630389 RepID=UPI002476D00B|nr:MULTISPECIES: glycosyltransferase family 4 protein [unclassified Dysgonomonas]MDH6307769.1 glycosyltransferase involved in cell wall biosynthesis [Dysgonomonas sp. PF1-14]MDH6337687.1 glycosyltransferase involved in cell wall biosynthesis [Dysgonomonas sp. PF1-16]MDH6378911.1 glycosyltransferase involved in cell wall biosynthesis [Dysgonomonas sp. PFB1-18]MDH6396546.1 glycosyltransferase involved in cell wall biosynthesis [Dysgonomonas sp. PF1-23]
MKILYYTKYTRKGASSRLRSYQYFPYLEQMGYNIEVSPLFDDKYLNNMYDGKSVKLLILWSYLKRFFFILKNIRNKVVFIEYELFPYLPAWTEYLLKMLGVKYIVDYDDAIFHKYEMNSSSIFRFFIGRKIDKVMKYSYMVIAGNNYLAERAHIAGAKRVQVIPTVIDLNRYEIKEKEDESKFVIGWIGTKSTFRYLYPLKNVLNRLIENYGIYLNIVGAKELLGLGENEVHIEWSEENEVNSILTFDVGIMPLEDGYWEKGKCGYKLIQYMGCGLPVIASSVGANNDIVINGDSGFLVQEENEWYKRLEQYIIDLSLRKSHGIKGRQLVESKYSVQRQVNNYIEIYNTIFLKK